MFLCVFDCVFVFCLFLSAFLVFSWLWAVLPEINIWWWWFAPQGCCLNAIAKLMYFGRSSEWVVQVDGGREIQIAGGTTQTRAEDARAVIWENRDHLQAELLVPDRTERVLLHGSGLDESGRNSIDGRFYSTTLIDVFCISVAHTRHNAQHTVRIAEPWTQCNRAMITSYPQNAKNRIT